MKNITKILKLEQKLKKQKNIKTGEIDITQIDNVKRVKIDTEKSSIRRILDFVISSKNPYVIKVNETIVKMEFSNNNYRAEECVNQLFYNLYLQK